MPRRHGSARERPERLSASAPRGIRPAWAQREDVVATEVVGDRPYRCPGCQQLIRPGTRHLVVIESGDVEGRRHWHTPCWRQERRRTGGV